MMTKTIKTLTYTACSTSNRSTHRYKLCSSQLNSPCPTHRTAYGSAAQVSKNIATLKKHFELASVLDFYCFCLDEKESLQGITALVVRLSGCLHTSRIRANGVEALKRVSFSERCCWGFCINQEPLARRSQLENWRSWKFYRYTKVS